ncbi:MAG: hypothetical protein KME13_14825 [Myxacorys californica WJT36-NPBG1]|jgi:hypothetical protein|nr:hypothetical protein [Myxacorys californica WJT36-NPBG1]
MNRYKREISTLSTAIASLGIGSLVLLSCIVASNWLAVQQDTKTTAKEKLNASLETSKAIFGGLGTVATITGGVVLYLNFRVASKTVAIAEKNLNIAKKKLEQDEEKFKEESELTESRLITDRFSKAVEQLSTGRPVECLGGIFLLERLAKDSPNDQWTIIKVLNAYVREKLPRSSDKTPKGSISNYDKQQIQEF